MSRFHMSDEMMARVAGMTKSGKSLAEIAAEMRISLEMARSAATKWPIIERLKQNHAL